MSTITTYAEAEQYLYQFINLERKITPFTKREYRLDRMETFLEFAGNPHKNAKCIHIAGSKGKGSTAVFIAALLEQHGFKTGLYTSPHILHLRERIQIHREPVSEEAFIEFVDKIEKILSIHPALDFPGNMQPTFFEIITCIGFMAFQQSQCDYWVLETGLGGRLDATNIVFPLVSILTPIEYEHEDVLGDTIEKIAAEKCGIIKNNIPVISSGQRDPAIKIIKETAQKKNASIEFIDDLVNSIETTVTAAGTQLCCHFKNNYTFECRLKMLGQHQAENAILAYLVAEKILGKLDIDLAKKALFSGTLPARLEILKEKPFFLVDGAHTPESIKRAVAVINQISEKPRTLLFACLLGKKYKDMADLLAPLFSQITISTPGFFRKSNPEEVYEYFCSIHENVIFIKNPEEAFQKTIHTEAPVFVMGSFYFAAEIRTLYLKSQLI